jgi:MraZ protein
MSEREENETMLTGKYSHSIDAKNRLIIPSKIKEQLGDTITILRGSDKCLTLYSAEEWENYARKISELPKTQVRALTRYLYSNSIEVQPDSQGRVMLPAEMVKYAEITKNIITVGCGKYAEIWSEEVWNEQNLDEAPEDFTSMLLELGL